MPVVSIAKIQDDNLLAAVRRLTAAFQKELELTGRSVLIKPNLVEPVAYTTGQTTNPALVEALILWCREQGAARIAVGEGPSYFQPASALRECFFRTGMAGAAERQKAEWILFDEGPQREFRNLSPALPDLFYVSEHAFTWDHIINVPVPKTHYLTTVSIAMKNLKGFIRREDKPSFHYSGREGIHGSVAELNRMVRPRLNVVDCTAPVHRNRNFLLGGSDIVATDTVMASLMGYSAREIRTIQLGHAAGLGEMDITRIELAGDDLKGLQMNFEQPQDFFRRAYPGLTLEARQACSGCLIPLFAALGRLAREGAALAGTLRVAAGRHGGFSNDVRTLCVGKCMREARGDAAWFPGCPPTKEELYAFLRDQFS